MSRLWSDSSEAIELAIFRLIEIAKGDDALAADARKVLGARLKASESLTYKLGAWIAAFLGATEAAQLVAEAERRAAEAEVRAAQLEQERHALSDRLESERALGAAAAEAEAVQADRANALADQLAKARLEVEALKTKSGRSPRAGLLILGMCIAHWPLGAWSVGLLRFGMEPRREEAAGDSNPDITAVVSDGLCNASAVDLCAEGSAFVEGDGFPEMIVIPGGSFMMGSPETEDGGSLDERPQQNVTVARFALARTEVTFDQWAACVADGFCETNPQPEDQTWGRDTRPVINVSWDDAQEFVDWLNKKFDGAPYRLPSEAEWEYAARAGGTGAYPWGSVWDPSKANGDGAADRTVEPGNYTANAFGLVDMIGNVWEWVEDCWRGDLRDQPADGAAVVSGLGADCARRVVRGGSWNNEPRNLRSANRNRNEPDNRNNNLGFRPASTLACPSRPVHGPGGRVPSVQGRS